MSKCKYPNCDYPCMNLPDCQAKEKANLLEDTVQQETATKEQIREAIVFNLPLYTTPQQRTWVGLTDEERNEIALEVPMDAICITEAKLKEKNT